MKTRLTSNLLFGLAAAYSLRKQKLHLRARKSSSLVKWNLTRTRAM